MSAVNVTKRAIDDWYDSLAPAGRVTCMGNDVYGERYATRLQGRIFEYQSGKNSIRLHEVGGAPDAQFWINRPKRVGDVVALSEDEITYVIRDGLKSTWRKVSAS